MYASVTLLRYWKSEYGPDTCEDACAFDVSRGLFAVADGVSADPFSGVWAKVLVEHFIRVPLTSADPFEAEWWTRAAQRLCAKAHGRDATKGNHSTFACVRVTSVAPSRASCRVLAVGDSCVFVASPGSREVLSFPLSKCLEFKRPPVCLPSERFNRDFHTVHDLGMEWEDGALVVLATDAVAKWVLGCAGNRVSSKGDALETLAACSASAWPAFVLGRREAGEMEDDDSTALVIRLSARPAPGYEPLGSTQGLDEVTARARQREHSEAVEANDAVRIAVTAGDQVWMRQAGIPVGEMARARKVAGALKEVLDALRANLDEPVRMRPVWENYAALLWEEPCAANVRNTLVKEGVISALGTRAVPPGPAEPALAGAGTAGPSHGLSTAQAQQPEDRRLRLIREAIQSDLDTSIAAVFNEFGLDDSGLSEGESERVRLAVSRVIEASRFQTALAIDDDTIICQIHEPSAALQRIIPLADMERYRLARRRHDALRRCRAALASQDERRIVDDYDSVLDGYSQLSEGERDSIERARRCIEMPLRLREALAANDEEAVVRAYDTSLERSFTGLSSEERQRIELAKSRVRLSSQLRKAVEAEDDVELSEVGALHLELGVAVPAAVSERVRLAEGRMQALRTFRAALASGDEGTIVDGYQPVLDGCSNVTPEERARLAEAKAVLAFREAVAGGDDERISVAYAGVRGSERVSPADHERGQRAERRHEALRVIMGRLATDDDAAIVSGSADVAMCLDHLTRKEFDRLWEAYTRTVFLWYLRWALAQDDDRLIADADDPLLEDHPAIDQAARRRIELAKKRSQPSVWRRLLLRARPG